jgi:hypothetical protein
MSYHYLRRTTDGSSISANWIGLAQNETGTELFFSEYGDRSVQVVGNFSGGATLVWEGSNNGTDYTVLRDPFGNAVSLTTAGLVAVTEATLYARPRVSGGDGGAALDVHTLIRRPVPAKRVVTDSNLSSL